MEITHTPYPSTDLIKVTGRLDSFTSPLLADAIKAITSTGRYHIVLDLSDAAYSSSAGLRVMIDTQKTCRKQEGELILAGVPPRIYETLEMAGFVTLFRFCLSANEAIAGLS